MVLCQEATHYARKAALPLTTGTAHQGTIGNQGLKVSTISLAGALDMGECGLNFDGRRQRQTHQVALTGVGNKHDSARVLLQLISGDRVGPPVNRLAEPLRSGAREPGLHCFIHINATVPATYKPVDHDRRTHIESA
jgi:hypothetical protein